jgi:serine/threonine protein phosphatase PrpC
MRPNNKCKNVVLLVIGVTFAFSVGRYGRAVFHSTTTSSQQLQQQQNSKNNSRLRATQSQQLPSADGTVADVKKLNEFRPFPYSKLQAANRMKQQHQQVLPPNYGRIPLTGSYTLDSSYQLPQIWDVMSGNGNDKDTTTASSRKGGIIYFPYADLFTLIPEEVTSIFNPFSPQDVNKVFPSVLVDNSGSNNNSVVSQSRNQAILTRCGFKPPMGEGSSGLPNQDRSFIANFFLSHDDDNSNVSERENVKEVPSSSSSSLSALLMGIYDGHGGLGHVVSHYVALELPRVFAETMTRQPTQTIRIGSSQYDSHITQILKDVYLRVDSGDPVRGGAGCTASTLFYPGVGPKAYVANVGDSTTLIVKYTKSTNQSVIVYQNRKHKPHLPDEKQRINAAGGEVMIPPSLLNPNGPGNNNAIGETSRLMVPSPNGSPFGGMALAMSRAIGDYDAKAVGLISEPEVDVWSVDEFHTQHKSTPEEIKDTEWFAVVASDGMYDVISPEEVVNKLGQSLYRYGKENAAILPLEACEQLIRKATLKWMNAAGGYRDDISLGVSKLKFVPV